MYKISELCNLLDYQFRDQIVIRSTSSDIYEKGWNIEKQKYQVHFAVFINTKFNLVMVFDVNYRTEHQWTGKHLSFQEKWSELKCENDKILTYYTCFQTPNGKFYEKRIVLHTDTLYKLVSELPSLMKFDLKDKNFPLCLSHTENRIDTVEDNRGRITTSRWNRKQIFRKEVLQAYGGQCAICRCAEKALLEAAHIQAVASGGSDAVSNGICLCANHHLMLDEHLIEIDYKNAKLSFVADSVKNMPWYTYFQDAFNSKLLTPNNN